MRLNVQPTYVLIENEGWGPEKHRIMLGKTDNGDKRENYLNYVNTKIKD